MGSVIRFANLAHRDRPLGGGAARPGLSCRGNGPSGPSAHSTPHSSGAT